ncbi:DUF4424 domain-containing protein [Bartonella sp. HY329]|uniref:DUF4424 domain-containing protein n=1 Tax=unclassified Bartonella TaxID=2645622 RepID=UPI0021C7D028|nr:MULTISPECIES: DUF4424 domain-containing protein [unclassified Bartonella]UXM96202.1 DUF4424 domain-containing protein [Bartonella sp. HY329]UXN10526.1 DUF4424 domain-containing protein [Bartonella sp. HY328]
MLTKHHKYMFIFLVITHLISINAYANDTEGFFAAGGLVLKKNENIKMVSEDLYISEEKIEVNYIFKNMTDNEITTPVVFPLPDHIIEDYSREDEKYFLAENDLKDANNYNFTVIVNGVKIKPKVHKKRLKFMDGEEVDDRNLAFSTSFYWQQTFPAKKEIKVRHAYTPMVGSGVPQPLDIFLDYIATDEYCPDLNFKKTIKAKQQNGFNNATRIIIGYILTTGGNWAGGTIEDFRLVVDKGSPSSVITFCGNNVKKISPTQFEMRAKNFKPKKDLDIMIIKKWGHD